MIVVLIVANLFGGITSVPMESKETCAAVAKEINSLSSRSISVYCINVAR